MVRRRKPKQQAEQSELFAPEIICFRLDDAAREILAGRASELDLSPHELARSYVVGSLRESEDRVAIRQAIDRLVVAIGLLRDDQAIAAEAILAFGGKLSEKQAAEWADQNLACSPSQNP